MFSRLFVGLFFFSAFINSPADRKTTLDRISREKLATRTVLAFTAGARPLEILYFPGTTDSNALIVGGIHGSELSSVQLAMQIINELEKGKRPTYNTWIIPTLFPDNANLAMSYPTEIGSYKNIGRMTHRTAVDPNRQFPSPGLAFSQDRPVDHLGRRIEMENQVLLEVIQYLKPARIAMLHAIRDTTRAGFFADPRTDCEGYAMGYDLDSMVAVNMAAMADKLGANVPGNKLLRKPTSLYHLDPASADSGQFQPRNFHGAGKKPTGVSMGTWGATGVCHLDASIKREPAVLLTIEFPGSRRPQDYMRPDLRSICERNMRAYAAALIDVYLKASSVQNNETSISDH